MCIRDRLNANHFDTFTSVFPQNIVPLHIYLFRALDAMMAHLRNPSVPLPPSQVVRTVTRPDAATPMTVANVPPFVMAPAPGNLINVSGTTVDVPQ